MEAYGKQVSITSFNTYIEMAVPLNRLIFDAVYGSTSWILSLQLVTLPVINFIFKKINKRISQSQLLILSLDLLFVSDYM